VASDAALIAITCFRYKATGQRYKAIWKYIRLSGKDIRLPEKGNSNFHGARPVHQIISTIKWIQTRRLSTKNSLSAIRENIFFCQNLATKITKQ